MNMARMSRATAGGSPKDRAAAAPPAQGWAERPWRCGRALGGAAGELVGGRPTVAAHQCAHLVEARVQHLRRRADAAALAARRPAASAARRMMPEAQISL